MLGGVYYWNVSATEIMRFDFGGTGLTPEVFLAPGDYGLPGGQCVGCHALSHDGTKIVASLNGQGGGQIVYLNNLASDPGPMGVNNTSYLTLAGDATNHIQFASFNPSGDEFVAVYGDERHHRHEPGPRLRLDREQRVQSLVPRRQHGPHHVGAHPRGTSLTIRAGRPTAR